MRYAYNQYGRISSVTRDYGGNTPLTHGYVYDAYGRLEETDYPSGLEAYYIYDGNGLMDGIQTNHNGDAWNMLSYDGLTMRSEVGTDGLHAVSVNDQWGRLTERYATVGSGTDKLFRLAFAYNLCGNVMSRTGVDGTGVTVQFTYDSLDRLTSAGSETYTYAPNGNILAKTGMGSYAYSSSKPHAVTHVGNTSGRMAEQTAAYDGMGRVTSVCGIGTGGPGYPSLLSGGTGTVPESIIPGHGNTVIGWGDRYDVAYGPDGERWRTSYRDTTVVFNNGSTSVRTLSRRDILYAGDYERVTDKDGTVRECHYLGQGVIAVVTDGGDASLYLAVTDNVGSYVHLVNAATGAAAFSVMYDPWGRMTRTAGRMSFHRGYGGHEMLTEFGLVNMNGRMYDFNTARFLSPDEYVQLPHDSQSFNRYSYCLNNPLKYTDPSGEIAIWDDIIIGAAAFLSSYVSSGISTHNWGWKSVQTGLLSAGGTLIGLHTGGLTGSVWANAGRIAANNAINTFMPSVTVPVSSHFSFTASPVFGFGTDGFSAGLFGAVNYTDDFSMSIGGGAGNGYMGWKVLVGAGDFSIGYGRTSFSDRIFNGNLLGAQTLTTYSVSYKDASFSISNDLWGDGEDRWRTTAAELSIGNVSIGTYVYTNHGGKESGWAGGSWKNEPNKDKYSTMSRIPMIGEMYAWKGGKSYFAPFWVGYSNNGQLFRFGISDKMVHRLTQNLVHKTINYPAYNDYSMFKSGCYGYYGRYNPVSIW